MTLTAATAVAFAVSGGSPTDARDWITVDLAGQPSAYRRGFVVMSESLDPTGRGEEMARQTRALILHELRRYGKQPADAALARAFAIANTYVYEEGRFRGGVGQEFKVGATAMIFEGHGATIAHVPPGQMVLAQDGLVYAIPELGSWLPHYASPDDEAPTPEPFGHASWTAPLLVQTELREGDTLVFSTSPVGRALAQAALSGDEDALALNRFHGRDPDRIMDAMRDLVVSSEIPVAAVAVVGFPPPERGSGIETVADIRRNARDQWRHTQAAARQFVPRRSPRPKAFTSKAIEITEPVQLVANAGEAPPATPPKRQPRREVTLQDRLIGLTERRATSWRDTWRQPAEQHRLGAPGAHGLSRYREVSLDASEPRWKHALPRMPFFTTPIFLTLLALLIVAVGTLAYSERDRFLPNEEDYSQYVVELDQRLLAVQELEDPAAIRTELARAEDDLAAARTAGAPSSVLRLREQQITLERDAIESVIRLDDVTRIGSLPQELQDGETQAIQTQGGVFLANGSLYRLRPESREMIIVLESGTQVEDKTVGNLFGVAYDGQTLITTDGTHAFFAGSADGSAWQAIELEEVNEQGPWPPGPVDAFGENLYLLVDEYRNIYQFVLDPKETLASPIDWVLTGDRVNFNMAVDMTIDGNIYALLEDGRVLTMRRGAQIAAFDIPTFDVDNEEPLAIIGGPMTGYLYVAVVDDDGHGRVIAMDREGGHVSQLALPDGFTTGNAEVLPPFDELQDIGVDEASGTLYLINGDGVWTVRYSLPPLPQPDGTPEATPDPAA